MAQAAGITIERNSSGDPVFAHIDLRKYGHVLSDFFTSQGIEVEMPPSGRPSENTVPCRMTADELRAEVIQSVKDARNGLGITVEQARARHPRLFTI
ncbi:MAG: hypothetical protein LBT78_12675 [Tannerella sp.]|jgi:hypothetical protein|nr:hypothetical protein [Tannerella sp.]